MKKFSDIAKQIEQEKKDIEILPTGLLAIDEYLEGGFLKKELVIIGAPTGKGKSLLSGTIFRNIAQQGYKCAYFSLEISNQMIISRLLGAESNLSPTRVMIKQLEDEELKKKNKAKAKLSVYEEFMYFYDDVYALPAIEKEIKDNKYDFAVIDFIQNIQAAKPDEYERLSHVALSFQKLAKLNNCCILAVSQLSNMMSRERKDDIVEYKGSGAIGHAADLGFFIEKSNEQNMMFLRLRKNRRGSSGQVFTFWVEQPGGRLIDRE